VQQALDRHVQIEADHVGPQFRVILDIGHQRGVEPVFQAEVDRAITPLLGRCPQEQEVRIDIAVVIMTNPDGEKIGIIAGPGAAGAESQSEGCGHSRSLPDAVPLHSHVQKL
jgi:hypothetical protein